MSRHTSPLTLTIMSGLFAELKKERPLSLSITFQPLSRRITLCVCASVSLTAVPVFGHTTMRAVWQKTLVASGPLHPAPLSSAWPSPAQPSSALFLFGQESGDCQQSNAALALKTTSAEPRGSHQTVFRLEPAWLPAESDPGLSHDWCVMMT